MSNTIVYAISLAVGVSIVNAVMNQLREGEPRLIQAIVDGLVVGIAAAAFRHWRNKKKTNSDSK